MLSINDKQKITLIIKISIIIIINVIIPSNYIKLDLLHPSVCLCVCLSFTISSQHNTSFQRSDSKRLYPHNPSPTKPLPSEVEKKMKTKTKSSKTYIHTNTRLVKSLLPALKYCIFSTRFPKK